MRTANLREDARISLVHCQQGAEKPRCCPSSPASGHLFFRRIGATDRVARRAV